VDVSSVKSVDLIYMTTKTSNTVKTAVKEPKLIKRGESVGDIMGAFLRRKGVR
jgi:hypothetical protein